MKMVLMMVLGTAAAAVAQTLPMAPASAPASPTTAAIAATQPAQTQPTTQPATQPTTQPATQPVSLDAEKMLEQLLRAKPGTAKPLTPLPDDEPQARKKRQEDLVPTATDVPLMREGDVISARIGRLQKAQREGDWEFLFESDGTTLQDPPITLLPNKSLARMEAAIKKSGADLRFRLTGVVTQYHGQNYLLIEKAEIVPDDF